METIEIDIIDETDQVTVEIIQDSNPVTLEISQVGEKGDKGNTGEAYKYQLFVYDGMAANPNIFLITEEPLNYSYTLLFINGLKQKYGIDYQINETILTWVSSNFDLSSDDLIEFYY